MSRSSAEDVVCADGTVQSFQGQLTDRLDLEEIGGGGQQALRDQYLSGLGLAAQASGEIRHRTDGPVIPATLEPDRANRRISLCDADAELEFVAHLAPCDAQLGDPRAHGQSHAHRALRGIGYRHRIIEEHHHAVAGKALEGAFVLEDQPPISPWYCRSTPMTSSGSTIS